MLTTHYLEEAEKLCDTIAIINHGRVIACEPKREILARIEEKEVVVELKTPLAAVPQPLQAFRATLVDPLTLRLRISKGATTMGDVLAGLQRSHLEVADLKTSETDLEDIFIQLTRSSAE